jgi:SAM-dependent methyltransferase
MYSASAAHYDRIYSFKDYAAEARALAELLRADGRRIRTVLDVACGTGAHAAALTDGHGFEVDGIDLDPALLAIAAAKCPRGRFLQADMTDLHLGRTFDAVLCLFGSIAYTVTPSRLRAALACLREHVAPGGVVIVEPFLTPDGFVAGHTSSITAESDGVRVTRSNRSERDGAVCRLNFDYVIEGPGGTQRANEVHELGLFSVDEIVEGFTAAGMVASYDPRGLAGRGLYVASLPRAEPNRAP